MPRLCCTSDSLFLVDEEAHVLGRVAVEEDDLTLTDFVTLTSPALAVTKEDKTRSFLVATQQGLYVLDEETCWSSSWYTKVGHLVHPFLPEGSRKVSEILFVVTASPLTAGSSDQTSEAVGRMLSAAHVVQEGFPEPAEIFQAVENEPVQFVGTVGIFLETLRLHAICFVTGGGHLYIMASQKGKPTLHKLYLSAPAVCLEILPSPHSSIMYSDGYDVHLFTLRCTMTSSKCLSLEGTDFCLSEELPRHLSSIVLLKGEMVGLTSQDATKNGSCFELSRIPLKDLGSLAQKGSEGHNSLSNRFMDTPSMVSKLQQNASDVAKIDKVTSELQMALSQISFARVLKKLGNSEKFSLQLLRWERVAGDPRNIRVVLKFTVAEDLPFNLHSDFWSLNLDIFVDPDGSGKWIGSKSDETSSSSFIFPLPILTSNQKLQLTVERHQDFLKSNVQVVASFLCHLPRGLMSFNPASKMSDYSEQGSMLMECVPVASVVLDPINFIEERSGHFLLVQQTSPIVTVDHGSSSVQIHQPTEDVLQETLQLLQKDCKSTSEPKPGSSWTPSTSVPVFRRQCSGVLWTPERLLSVLVTGSPQGESREHSSSDMSALEYHGSIFGSAVDISISSNSSEGLLTIHIKCDSKQMLLMVKRCLLRRLKTSVLEECTGNIWLSKDLENNVESALKDLDSGKGTADLWTLLLSLSLLLLFPIVPVKPEDYDLKIIDWDDPFNCASYNSSIINAAKEHVELVSNAFESGLQSAEPLSSYIEAVTGSLHTDIIRRLRNVERQIKDTLIFELIVRLVEAQALIQAALELGHIVCQEWMDISQELSNQLCDLGLCHIIIQSWFQEFVRNLAERIIESVEQWEVLANLLLSPISSNSLEKRLLKKALTFTEPVLKILEQYLDVQFPWFNITFYIRYVMRLWAKDMVESGLHSAMKPLEEYRMMLTDAASATDLRKDTWPELLGRASDEDKIGGVPISVVAFFTFGLVTWIGVTVAVVCLFLLKIFE
ncbi:unnamed protein product [Cyprideis torosa]|uniref:Uncharacterized protein n=1 Tax=Cyprideis torosa TaxID=163714 RepID=A0A7R8ZR75_9CRUS|nr:unnamed protein product [Cyprideis torosa]CAG0893627.1 unnamed protein product [Cyprideis torosa]